MALVNIIELLYQSVDLESGDSLHTDFVSMAGEVLLAKKHVEVDLGELGKSSVAPVVVIIVEHGNVAEETFEFFGNREIDNEGEYCIQRRVANWPKMNITHVETSTEVSLTRDEFVEL